MQVENPEDITSDKSEKKYLKYYLLIIFIAIIVALFSFNKLPDFKAILKIDKIVESPLNNDKAEPIKKEPAIIYKDAVCNNLQENKRIFITPEKNNEAKINTFIGCDDESKKEGLSGVIELAENDGMLFVFEKPDFYKFWMKDTSVYLSIAFLNENKEIIEIFEPEPLSEERFGPTSQKTKYVLEVGKGWFENKKVLVGDKFKF